MKKTIYLTAIIASLLLTAYLGLWAYSVQWFGQEVDNLYAQKKEGVEFLGPKPVLSNFPFVPEISYTNGIKTGNAEVLFPRVVVRGYPVPFTALNVTFPEGVSLGGIVDPRIWTLDSLEATMVIPAHLPRAFTERELSAWRKNGGKINVQQFRLAKQSLLAEGHGLLFLDEKLQPVFTMESTIRGYDAFVREQIADGLLESFAGMIGLAILNNLAKDDPETTEKTVTLTVNVKDRMMSVGPLKALPLPEIVWGEE